MAKSRKQKKRQRDDDHSDDAKSNRKRSSSVMISNNNPTPKQSFTEMRPLVESSALVDQEKRKSDQYNVTLLLFYQYVEPPWTTPVYQQALQYVEQLGNNAQVTGRMRIAREGFNCTLTGTTDAIRNFIDSLRQWKTEIFSSTEFKLTHHLPHAQKFPNLKILPVTELVHYGLEGTKAPPIAVYQGTHLEPQQYHEKLTQDNTVVIDVRNHYEATIGRFDPPGAKYLDPKMRKSTEFPVWLEDPKTQEELKGKQVLMYCTGGIRCERATALLKYKMEKDPKIKGLNIQGVYHLQGGIDKYFKEYPDGGYWKGKNYVFDKRFAHAPPTKDPANATETETPMGKCEACGKAWDMYRGKRRCPTCGVPSLICRDCWKAHQDGTRVLDRSIRCDLCVEENVRSKQQLREKHERDIQEYEACLRDRGLLCPSENVETLLAAPNPQKITRVFLKNMCRKSMTEDILLSFLPSITHVVWRNDRKSGRFLGQAWAELESPDAAGRAVAKSGEIVCGRPIYINYDAPDVKDAWPPPNSTVKR